MAALTPVSERSSDEDASLRPQPLNFSRPRPGVTSQQKLQRDSTDSESSAGVRAINAFHAANTDLPTEPRFSIVSQRTDTPTPTSANSAASEFAWDGALGELRSRRRPEEYDRNQRYAKSPHSRSATSTSHGSASTAVASDEPLLPPSQVPSADPPPIPQKLPKIVKRTDVDQQSERMSLTDSARGDWEDAASHHTVSVNGDAESGHTSEGRWSSSEHDISGLSNAEIQKLKKKGINPALYAEMKAARKGKGKWVGPLVGNTYLG